MRRLHVLRESSDRRSRSLRGWGVGFLAERCRRCVRRREVSMAFFLGRSVVWKCGKKRREKRGRCGSKKISGGTRSVGPWIVQRGGICVLGRMRAVGILRTGGAGPSGFFAPSGLPDQFVDFVLEGPLIGFLTVSMAHGVVADIIPFFGCSSRCCGVHGPKNGAPRGSLYSL